MGALTDQSQEDASNGRNKINSEAGNACAGIDMSMHKIGDAFHAQNQRDDDEISKLQARIDELKAAKEERHRQREEFDVQAQTAKTSLGIDAQRHCLTVDAWQQGVEHKVDSASARAGSWRTAISDALASRPEVHIDM